ncbi:GH21767 [Drosophila grimshawi]|uniref:GH21767 n=1 Tax=Drosophila grimshawi TaxID=7222 RepID=B4J6U9_DROGR|nr:GH21767 [Drosophila grimshawi]
MALSFLSQSSGLLDIKSIFDPQYSLQQHQQENQHQQHQQQQQQQQQLYLPSQQQHQHQQQQHYQISHISTKFDLSIFNDFDQMEFNNNLSRNHNQYQNNNNNNDNNSTINNNNNHNNNNNNSEHLNQVQNRHFMSGYHHQHIGSDYEQVINFVDSPPTSEESWTDAQSKDSPGPHIIDVRTIYSESGSRKRRMDWDSLDIGQSENSPTTQSGDIPNKVAHLEKDKHKREKHSGRSSWSDDIGFDLNADFNSNSYLNNENFLAFSPSLTALKQEPQTEQLKPTAKLPLDSSSAGAVHNIGKIDKSPLGDANHSPQRPVQSQEVVGAASGTVTAVGNSGSESGGKHELNSAIICGCGSPQSSPASTEFELKDSATNRNATATDKTIAASGNEAYAQAPRSELPQQVSVVEAAKIEPSSSSGASHAEDHKFQYILAAATSIATKNNEETLTYLNQGQSYEIKLKKIGDLSFYRDKILKSVIKICFHERRLQFMEREQMQQWQASRPGDRIIEVDVPLSYGLCHVSQPLSSSALNTVEIFWDPFKEVGVYVKVNCISTEFTPKKHGGEKGVPFRLQIETYIENSPANSSNSNTSSSTSSSSSGSGASGTSDSRAALNGKQAVHAAACQIKVFKLKGADRKHKQDREKIQKRPTSEQDKFQPSYECTIMNDISLDLITPTTTTGCYSPEYMKLWPNSPVHVPKYDGMLPFASSASPAASSSPIAINSVTSTNSPTLKLMDATNMVSPPHVPADMEDYNQNIMPDSTPAQVTQWLTNHRLTAYLATFTHFSGADIMRMSKEDLIQICGLADGIRMFNILRAKTIAPRLTLYASMDGYSYNAIYLLSNTAKELQQKLYKLPGFYEFMAKGGSGGALENGGVAAAAAAAAALYNNWGMHSKYSGSGSNIFNEVNKSCVYISGPSGILVSVTDEVLNNEIKDGSLYSLDVQGGKVVLKFINKQDNN